MSMIDISGALRAHWKAFLIEGVVLMLLGAAAILIPTVSTLAVALFLGWLFLIGGVVSLVTTFWMRGAPGFFWSAMSAALGILVGIILIGWPASGAVSLTLVLIVFFVIDGVLSIMYALEHRRALSGRWGWLMVNGIIDLVLAAVIFAGLPAIAAWAIGLLVGIDLLFGGMSLATMALAARKSAAG